MQQGASTHTTREGGAEHSGEDRDAAHRAVHAARQVSRTERGPANSPANCLQGVARRGGAQRTGATPTTALARAATDRQRSKSGEPSACLHTDRRCCCATREQADAMHEPCSLKRSTKRTPASTATAVARITATARSKRCNRSCTRRSHPNTTCRFAPKHIRKWKETSAAGDTHDTDTTD